MSYLKTILLALVCIVMTGCAGLSSVEHSPQLPSSKIKFSLDEIHPDGLRGSVGGLVSVAYEFCVPANDKVYQEVRGIDPSIQIQPSSRGRIACATNQALSIGETHQPHWKDVLNKLAALPYIAEIRKCDFE